MKKTNPKCWRRVPSQKVAAQEESHQDYTTIKANNKQGNLCLNTLYSVEQLRAGNQKVFKRYIL